MTTSVKVEQLGGRACVVERRAGTGVPVVFVNGCGLTRGLWGAVADHLTQPVVLFDRPGLGTPWPERLPTLAEEVATLRELVLGLDRVILVAHSMASLHVEALLLQHPELVTAGRITGLVLVDPSIECRRLPSWPSMLAHLPDWARAFSARFNRAAVESVVVFTRAQTVTRLAVPARRALRGAYADPDALGMAAAEFLGYRGQFNELVQVRPRHRWTPPPTTILTTRSWVPRRPVARFVERWAAAHVIVSGSRHLVMVDAPEAVTAAIARPGVGA